MFSTENFRTISYDEIMALDTMTFTLRLPRWYKGLHICSVNFFPALLKIVQFGRQTTQNNFSRETNNI